MLVIQNVLTRQVFALDRSTGRFEPEGAGADQLRADLLLAQEDEPVNLGLYWAAVLLEQKQPSRWKVLQSEAPSDDSVLVY